MMSAVGIAAQAGTALLVLIFLRAAWHKGADLARAEAMTAAYELLPPGLVAPAVRLLAVLELVAALGLILPATRPEAAAIAGLLLLAYGHAMIWVLLSGRDRVDCGCGGAPQMISWLLVVRNLGLALVAVLAAVPTGAGDAIGAAVALLAGLTAWAVLGTAEMLGANHRYALRPEKRK